MLSGGAAYKADPVIHSRKLVIGQVDPVPMGIGNSNFFHFLVARRGLDTLNDPAKLIVKGTAEGSSFFPFLAWTGDACNALHVIGNVNFHTNVPP